MYSLGIHSRPCWRERWLLVVRGITENILQCIFSNSAGLCWSWGFKGFMRELWTVDFSQWQIYLLNFSPNILMSGWEYISEEMVVLRIFSKPLYLFNTSLLLPLFSINQWWKVTWLNATPSKNVWVYVFRWLSIFTSLGKKLENNTVRAFFPFDCQVSFASNTMWFSVIEVWYQRHIFSLGDQFMERAFTLHLKWQGNLQFCHDNFRRNWHDNVHDNAHDKTKRLSNQMTQYFIHEST